ncbi:thermonuclease family protein [Priestia megaterium]
MKDNNVRTIKITRVIDGDTVVGTMHLLNDEIQLHNQHFRLWGVDTPERKEAGFNEATEFTRKLVDEKTVTGKVYGKDAFGRWLTDIFIADSEKTVSEVLIERKLGVVYTH